jgi:hypothetical protein
MPGNARRVRRYGLFTKKSSICRWNSQSYSSIGLCGCGGVALTTTMSTGPSEPSMAVNMPSISGSLVTSARKSPAVTPCAVSSVSAASARAVSLA